MLVCHCHNKTDRDISRAVTEGAKSCADIASRCDAGNGCGGCLKTINSMLRSRYEKGRGGHPIAAERRTTHTVSPRL